MRTRRDRERVEGLRRKFGRWTWLVMYGPLILLGVCVLWFRYRPSPAMARLNLLLVAAFLAWGLYLCVLTARSKGERPEDDENGEETDHG